MSTVAAKKKQPFNQKPFKPLFSKYSTD